MSEPFLGEIRTFSFGIIPRGWMPCDGQILSINNNQPLFSLLGTTYGGDGRTTFALPDLRGRVPVHTSPGVALGQRAGEEAHTLITTELPQHTHQAMANASTVNSSRPAEATWGKSDVLTYNPTSNVAMYGKAFSATGNNAPHENRQPFNVVQFCIAVEGIYPSRP